MHDKPSDKAVEMAVQSVRRYVRHKYATSLGIGKPESRTSKDTHASDTHASSSASTSKKSS